MSVCTSYDELRDSIKKELDETYANAIKLLDKSIWGYDEMKNGYAIGIISDLQNLIDKI